MTVTLAELPGLAAKKFGDRTALATDGREFGFRELDALSGILAHNLVDLGVEPGDRVTLYQLREHRQRYRFYRGDHCRPGWSRQGFGVHSSFPLWAPSVDPSQEGPLGAAVLSFQSYPIARRWN